MNALICILLIIIYAINVILVALNVKEGKIMNVLNVMGICFFNKINAKVIAWINFIKKLVLIKIFVIIVKANALLVTLILVV
jgi:hypothetical protein